MTQAHTPVLLEEVLNALNLAPGKIIVDGTVGLGGHAKEVCKAIAPNGTLVAIDRDARNLQSAVENLAGCANVVSYQGSYADIHNVLRANNLRGTDGVLLDLGYSSVHVDEADRGFSFQKEGPLDMRYDVTSGVTAAEVVNTYDEQTLATLFRQYGEEKAAGRIAKGIVDARANNPFETTTQLAEVISQIVPRSRGQKIHPATRVFQALRIAVNDEFGHLAEALPRIVSHLEPGGRLAIITFHSVEDRLVKRFIEEEVKEGRLLKVNKKVIVASHDEVRSNPRARSAKLRVAEKYDSRDKTTTRDMAEREGSQEHPAS